MDWTIIGLSILCWFFAFVFFAAGIFAIPGNPGPNDPMLRITPTLWIAAAVSVLAGVAGLVFGFGWLAPHGDIWRGETFVAAPLVLIGLVIIVLVDSTIVRVSVIAIAAVLLWARQFPWFQELLLWGLLGLLVLPLAAGFVFAVCRRIISALSVMAPARARPSDPVPRAAILESTRIADVRAGDAVRKTIADWIQNPAAARAQVSQPFVMPSDPVPCRLMWGGTMVALFQAAEGLPPETNPYSFRDVQATDGSPDAGSLTFHAGSTNSFVFAQWFGEIDGAAPRDIGVDVLRDNKKLAAITLRGCRASYFGHGARRAGALEIKTLVLDHQGWKHSWKT